MHLVVRPAVPEDGAALARLFDDAYGGGYSPTFDRDGPLQPTDLWWVQSEKDVSVIEVNRRPGGLIVVGRQAGQWLVEDLWLSGYGAFPPAARDALVQRVAAHLAALFERGRQTVFLLRAAETNAFGLAVAHHLQAAFANALVVYRYRGAKRPFARAPEGYQIRRAVPADARTVGRLAREVEAGRGAEVERVLGTKDGRGYVALREQVLVGFGVVETRSGRGDWIVGVRDSHRRRGVGRALAASVLGVLHGRTGAPHSTAWALDPVAGAFLRHLGFLVERTYLYLERPL
jgi:GNAT superfamily N-acetyltransferase